MLRYDFDHSELVSWAVAKMIPHAQGRGFGRCKAMGVLDPTGKLIAGVVYHNYDPVAGTIEISGAALPGSRWLTRETITRMYDYAFIDCGVQMVIQRTPRDAESLLRQLAAGGYELIRVPRLFGRERDGVMCLLMRETWERSKFVKHERKPIEEAA